MKSFRLFGAIIAIAIPLVVLPTPAFATTQVATWSALQNAFTAVASGGSNTVQLGAALSVTNDMLTVGAGANVTLDLHGQQLSIVNSTGNYAGIRVLPTGSLIIEDTVGGGVLTVVGYGAAGIGGLGATNQLSTGNITIHSGTVNASSSLGGAGIGGGQSGGVGGTIGNILIDGGSVTATGAAYYGAGIGPGANATGAPGSITIGGSAVVVASAASGFAPDPGIGSGAYQTAALAVPITITGCPSITATGGSDNYYGGGAGMGTSGAVTGTTLPTIVLNGTAVAGSSTDTAPGGAIPSGNAGGTAYPLSFTGNSSYLFTTSSSVGSAVGSGGVFTLTCTAVSAPPSPSPTPSVPTVLAATGFNAASGMTVVGGLLLAGIATAGLAFYRRKQRG